MINPQKAADLLRQAAENIESALALLDLREQGCGECGTRHWARLPHARVNQQFDDAPLRLRAAAGRLEEDMRQQQAHGAKER